MNQIEQDIKNKQFHNFYLLYGEEDYLKNKYANLLINNIVENKDSMNYSYYEDRDIDSNDVIGTAVTLPFFADKRIIHIKNSNWFKSPNEDFNNYLSEICDSTVFLFVENAVDKRSKAFKTLSKIGVVLELNMPNSNDIRNWIGNKLKEEHKSMEREAYQEFLLRTDSNMENMDREFEKLICYIGDNDTITLHDVEEICTKQIQSKVFDMINGIAEKNPKKVLDMYHDLLASKEPPIKILILIQRQFRRSIQIKDLREQGYSDDRIAKELKIQNFIIGKELRMTRNFSTSTMNNLLEDACNLEKDIKTGNIKDQLAVELLMMKYAS
ncbi:MAG TPA: DNA polymerase III subunit delta [Lachnospiraceae bacterium]|nr:DNA polymerase III subunit delta [Lachnospiraceae bacterium]